MEQSMRFILCRQRGLVYMASKNTGTYNSRVRNLVEMFLIDSFYTLPFTAINFYNHCCEESVNKTVSELIKKIENDVVIMPEKEANDFRMHATTFIETYYMDKNTKLCLMRNTNIWDNLMSIQSFLSILGGINVFHSLRCNHI